eukprot:2258028-Amphidinium_carterae.2
MALLAGSPWGTPACELKGGALESCGHGTVRGAQRWLVSHNRSTCVECGEHAIDNCLPAEAAEGIAYIQLQEAGCCIVLLRCFEVCQHCGGAVRTPRPVLIVAQRWFEVLQQRAGVYGRNDLFEDP